MKNICRKSFIILCTLFLPQVVLGLEISDLNSVEKRSLELACSQNKSQDICTKKHLFVLSKIKRINLEPLNQHDRLALKYTCETETRLSKGPALYHRCLADELRDWFSSTRVHLTEMSKGDQADLVASCRSDIYQGLVKFHQCLLEQLEEKVRERQGVREEPKDKDDSTGTEDEGAGKESFKDTPVGPSPSAEQLFKKLSPSVLMVGAWKHNGKLGTTGSGVAVSKFLILTNYHVIEGKDYFRVKNGQFDERATIYWSDPDGDMCILRVGAGRLVPVRKFRFYDDIKIGEKVYTLGSPSGLENTFAEGMLSGKRTQDGRNYLQTTASISPGSSGGGLFDAEGQLIGITTFLLEGNDLFFAIPIDSFPPGIRKN